MTILHAIRRTLGCDRILTLVLNLVGQGGPILENVQFLKYVSERDVDLLLLEEIHVSAPFRSWLIEQVCGPHVQCHSFLGAWHSVSDSAYGESDLVVRFVDNSGGVTAILIENKIDAPPQPDQAFRYRLRGDVGISKMFWRTFRTCITAPELYLAGTSEAEHYDVCLSYEMIRDAFQRSDPANERSVYRARVLSEAIEQNRRGYTPSPHHGVTKFWFDYWKLAEAEFRHLGMANQGQTPARHSWARFGIRCLGTTRWVIHKLDAGAVDYQLASGGDSIENVEQQYRHLLAEGFQVVKTGKSISLRIPVPEVDRFAEFELQANAVRDALNAATRFFNLTELH